MPNLLQASFERLGLTHVPPKTLVERLIDFDPKNCFEQTKGITSYSFEPLKSEAEMVEIKRHLESAVAGYPSSFIVGMIRKIYVVRDLSLNGLTYGGTICLHPPGVLLATFGRPGDAERQWIDLIFHHELAHVVLTKNWNAFPHLDWHRANPPHYRYPHTSGFDAATAGLSADPDSNLHSQGFISPYSASSYEEDVVSYAEKMFSWRDHGFWRAVALNDRMRMKVKLIRSFYRRVHPTIKFPDES